MRKVSIIIPVYNGSNYMREAIDSALSQTYKTFEVIVVNDGSDDSGKTSEIARSYGTKIRYFEKENGGVASALNLGISQMEGEFFSWLSHDDVYKPDKLETEMRLIERYGQEVIIYSNLELIDSRSKLISTIRFEKRYDIHKLNTPYYLLFRRALHGCTLLFHKAHFDRVGLFDEALKTTQDYALWFKMFRGQQVVFCPDVLVGSRQHEEQGSKSIPTHQEEGNRLWVNLINEMNTFDMCQMEGSPYQFYREVYKSLNNCYQRAADICAERMKHIFDYQKIVDELNEQQVREILISNMQSSERLYDKYEEMLEKQSTKKEVLKKALIKLKQKYKRNRKSN